MILNMNDMTRNWKKYISAKLWNEDNRIDISKWLKFIV